MGSLKGRTALITGASRRIGIGFGTARRLASMGADLFLHSFSQYDKQLQTYREEDNSAEMRAELEAFGIAVKQLDADFLDALAPALVMKSAAAAFGHVDILVLNHTYDTLKKLDELTAEEIDRHLHVNIRASLLLIQEFARQHDGRQGGRIIMLTSGQHLGPMEDTAYAASKGALHQLTPSLSSELIEKGITVNTVNPGPTKTYEPSAEVSKAVLERMPQGRWGEADDAARLISWLVSDDAQWITGQVIDSEGAFQRG